MGRIPIQHRSIAIGEAFQTLLSTKHLYQSYELPLDFIDKIIEQEEFSSRHINGKLEEEVKSHSWKLLLGQATKEHNDSPIDFRISNIKTFCHTCNERQAFKVFDGYERHWRNTWVEEAKFKPFKPSPIFYFAFLCQGCQATSVDFLVAREGLKLTICGRSPVEAIPAPNDIPKKFRKHYSNAVVAANAGQVLAGLFLLRVCIEQFWHSTAEVKELVSRSGRATGDEMGAAYKTTLPEDFKSRFPTLLEVYGELSEAMHTAREDAELFQSACSRIIEHFEARRLFKINTTTS
ncbi:MAG: hypothetical protein ACJAQT_003997 [Akkermansiaceae bacterium]|jgi:hypothetical protein